MWTILSYNNNILSVIVPFDSISSIVPSDQKVTLKGFKDKYDYHSFRTSQPGKKLSSNYEFLSQFEKSIYPFSSV